MGQPEKDIRKQSVSSTFRDIEARFEHLANYTADVEQQLMLERADRKTIIRNEIEEIRKKLREEIETEMQSQFASREKALKEKEEALNSKEDTIIKREDDYAKTQERKEQEIGLKYKAEFNAKLDSAIEEARQKLVQMVQGFIEALNASKSGNLTHMQKYLDKYEKEAVETQAVYNKELAEALASANSQHTKKRQQCEYAIRRLYLQKSELWKPTDSEREEVQKELLKKLELTDAERADYDRCRDSIKAYRNRIKAQKELEHRNNMMLHGRTIIPDNLLRLDPIMLYPENYVGNEHEYRIIGHDDTEEIVPCSEKYVIRVYRRLVVVKKDDIFDKPIEVPLPERIIYKSYASAELLSRIEVRKFYYHLPFYRQEKMMKMEGYPLKRSTMDGWHKEICALLEPIYKLQKQKVLESKNLAADGCPMPMIDNLKHKTVNKYLIELRSIDTGIPVFTTAPPNLFKGNGRGKAVVQDLLDGWQGGGFMCDACSSYDWLKKVEKPVDVVLCRSVAHLRRDFERAGTEDNVLSHEALLMLQQIYSVEEIIKALNLKGADIVSYRKKYALPVWGILQTWALKYLLIVPVESLIRKAINYLLTHFDELTGYICIAGMPIDNNDTERAIREMVMGKNAYLFCENELSCHNAAIMYSLFGACKVLGKDPEAWLTYVLKHIKSCPKDNLVSLLPEFFMA